MTSQEDNEEWTLVIKPRDGWFELKLWEIWKYRDLLMTFVRRDFIAQYKQTILGPLWFFIQPIMTTIVFTIVFGKIVNVDTNGIPQFLFYMGGVTIWNYFSFCLTKTSAIFIENVRVFEKVYFPRLVVPLSVVISNLLKFGVQFLLFVVFVLIYAANDPTVQPNSYILLLPVLLILMAGIGLGFGLLFSSLTTKYRDVQFLVVFGVQLLMYLTPVAYPMSRLSGMYKTLMSFNPLAPVVEIFRYAFLGDGGNPDNIPDLSSLGYSFIIMIVLLFVGVILFKRVEKTSMDTV